MRYIVFSSFTGNKSYSDCVNITILGIVATTSSSFCFVTKLDVSTLQPNIENNKFIYHGETYNCLMVIGHQVLTLFMKVNR